MRSEGEDDASLLPLLGGALEQQVNDHTDPAIAYGTYQHAVGIRSTKTVVLGGSSLNSAKKFECQFDAGPKSGRVLVMIFDREGRPTFKEMSRQEVLRMTQEAAEKVVSEDMSSSNLGKLSPPLRKRSSLTSASVRRLGQQSRTASQQDLYTPVSVQLVHSRDIRKMENAFSVTNEPRITVRKQAILISADPLRAIILRDTCLIYVPDEADTLLLILESKFAESTREDNAPFEFRALEALLSTLSRYFELQYEELSPAVIGAVDGLMHGGLDARKLEKLRELKNTVNEFEAHVDGVRRVLMMLLDNEENLRLLFLTKLYNEPNLLSDLWSIDGEEIEVLIENYLQDIFSTRTKSELLQHRISNAESLVMMQLDSMRNYLLGVDLIFSIVVISISIGTFITGIFGMNLHSGLESTDGWFLSVAILTVLLSLILTIIGIFYFKLKGVLLQ
ncbi:unnamed protein product [Peronospora effusa]|uniref:Magnesium transporter n=1 Tax=Peronospora effusa TaxID=542832 RepID=A0A3M6VGB2_9STRA|nr:hypothetical protein DD238_002192 [Peronospora effusa]RQM13676.1 hypothetical protein DD237_003207 [Peronospora effusa]CAI5703497.1 unnamed protein product [Peronospora effusa]